MNRSEAKTAGVLMEANRVFFHPLGLEMRTSGAGGFEVHERAASTAVFPPGALTTEEARAKCDAVAVRRRRAGATRRTLFGWTVQQVDGRPEATPLDFVWTERAIAHLASIAERDEEAGLIAHQVVDILSECWLLPGGVIDYSPPEDGGKEEARLGLSAWQVGRLLWLARNLPDIGAANEVAHPEVEGVVERPYSGLYANEIAEAEVLGEEVAAWTEEEPAPERPAQVLKRLEDLYGLAQPGMRFFRGDPKALDAWDGVRERVADEMAKYLADRPEVDRFLQGDLRAEDLEDADAVASELADRLAPLDEQEARVAEELEGVRRIAGPIRVALYRLRGEKAAPPLPVIEPADLLSEIAQEARTCEDASGFILWLQEATAHLVEESAG